MREAISKLEGQRLGWTATFVKFGTKRGFQGRPPIPTLLVRDVKDTLGRVVADHLWFAVTKEFDALPLEMGVEVAFVARVEKYEKGYQGGRDLPEAPPVSYDYRLSHPSRVRLHSKLTPLSSDWTGEAPDAAPKEQLGLFG